MYVGSTMCFLGGALWSVLLVSFLLVTDYGYRETSPAGLFITLYVYIVYIIALRFEGYVIQPCRKISCSFLPFQALH